MTGPPMVTELGESYVRQIVDCSPGQRKRYLDQLRILTEVSVGGPAGHYSPFARNVTQVHEADIKAWLIGWDRSLKTKANYHGLLFGVFNHALEQGFVTVNPCQRTAPKRSRIRQSQAGPPLPHRGRVRAGGRGGQPQRGHAHHHRRHRDAVR
jgi:hypothetical protein